jgi:uncharacterized metal-binding protein
MPSFSNHLIFNMIILTLFIIYLRDHPIITVMQTFIFCIGYFIGSVMLTPDLDTKSEASNRCGILSVPYRAMFKHRGMSHNVILGVATRILYFLIIIAIIVGILGLFTRQNLLMVLRIVMKYKLEILIFIMGLFFSNLFHIVLDKITTKKHRGNEKA